MDNIVQELKDMKSNKTEEVDPNYPYSKDGNKDDLTFVLNTMKIPIKKDSEISDWVSSYTNDKLVSIKNRKVVQGVVPNVKGMGLNPQLSFHRPNL